jgi:LysM repeat protein
MEYAFMRCQYIIQPGDTFEKIALQFYNNPVFAEKICHYNGLYNPEFVIVGQSIEIPTTTELNESARCQTIVRQPQGYQQILDDFGNIYEFVDDDGCFEESAWTSEILVSVKLPFAVALSWDHSRQIRKVHCHKKLVDIIKEAFCAVEREGLAEEIITLGDFYNFRSKRSSGKLSTHCWGIAFDVNPEINLVGSKGSMSDELVALFGEFGFSWGGTTAGKFNDPMHFQYCRGY